MELRAPQPHHDTDDRRDDHYSRQHHRAPSAIGHWTRTIGALVPLVITEVVPNPAKQIRFIRIASVALAVLNEGRYAYQVSRSAGNETKTGGNGDIPAVWTTFS
jgi:hypothetical protein